MSIHTLKTLPKTMYLHRRCNGPLAVQWTTRDTYSTVNGYFPTVQWGIASGQYTFESLKGTSQTYTRDDMCGSPANSSGWNIDPGYFHYAVMTGLVPGQRYYYRYGGKYEQNETKNEPQKEFLNSKNNNNNINIEEEWSKEASFVSPPSVKSSLSSSTSKPTTAESASSVRVVAMADVGQVEIDGSMETSQMDASIATTRSLEWEVSHNGAQLLIHTGDISYARGFMSQWDVYWNQLGPAVRAVPYMTVPGNHERDWPGSGDRFQGKSWDSGGECGVAYNRRTNMPTTGLSSGMGPNSMGEVKDQPW